MPPRKKIKTAHPSSENTSGNANASSEPDIIGSTGRRGLCDLPTEVLHMIGGLLHPKDLFSLCHTCKDIRACYWSKGAERVIWYKDAAEQVATVDPALSDAILDWETYPDFFTVLSLSSRRYNDRWNLLLRRDVDAVVKRYKKLTAPVSKDALDQFTGTLEDEYSQRQECRKLEEWLSGRRTAELRSVKDRRLESILDRLCKAGWGWELGYMDHLEMDNFAKLPSVRLPKPLTDAEWPRVMNAVQATLDKVREDVFATERQIELRVRHKDLQSAIQGHCVQFPRTAHMMLHPKPIDFAFRPKCRTILERSMIYSYGGENIPFRRMTPGLVKRWNADVKKKLTRHLCQYLPPVPSGVDPLNLAIAIFTCSHCTGVSNDTFQVNARARIMRYPEVLCHQCLRIEDGDFPNPEDDLYTRIVTRPNFITNKYKRNEERERLTWRCKPFSLDRLIDGPVAVAHIERMRRVVSALGLDATRATTDELKACGGWLRCALCEPGGPEAPVKHVYDWVAAFDHEHVHFGSRIDGGGADRDRMWQRVDQPEVLATVVEELEPVARNALLSDPGPYWCCSLCDYESSIEWVDDHLEEVHNMEDAAQAIQDGTIFRHPWIDPDEGRCIKLV
ncbi:uncharacterized protein TRAVEDRAFT_74785 [Trametes versicolor FP-101664 SS1]|uniref:uncharacterized protein n=1 Tax=Trametes versicolor (strain FP-101664) TaxID=717944 RepID=UPI00046228D9|nr:uncharacterized protein TRAVEDRAFT_74785 [Trametes versicolor FP-101664 SS1]EIW53474.1 hypothetical protein TRAVEDRAFT_74785 [Trametes versicolor FP-101664 SS1]